MAEALFSPLFERIEGSRQAEPGQWGTFGRGKPAEQHCPNPKGPLSALLQAASAEVAVCFSETGQTPSDIEQRQLCMEIKQEDEDTSLLGKEGHPVPPSMGGSDVLSWA